MQRRHKAQYGARLAGWTGALLLVLAACAPRPEKPDPLDIQAARQAALGVDTSLRTDILDRLDRNEDPLAVYQAYRDHIHDMTSAAAAKAGVELKRTSLRTRNPANMADDWEIKQLDQFQFLLDAGMSEDTLETAEIVKDGKAKYFRWMRPILMTENCLVCHGDKIDAKLLALLKADYADDSATGYFEGEIGGAYSVLKRIK